MSIVKTIAIIYRGFQHFIYTNQLSTAKLNQTKIWKISGHS